MQSPYEDIMHLPHHVSKTRPQMTMMERAAQFSPFAALTGYDAAIKETGRLTDEKIELEDEAKDLLNRKQQFLASIVHDRPEITVTYFIPDERKSGGSYVTITGNLRRIDEVGRLLIMANGQKISLDDISDIEAESFGQEFTE